MQKLRRLHLYLGCFFAPMLLFFAISGIWQTLGWNDHSYVFRVLSTAHKNQGLKGGLSLNSPLLALFAIFMSLGLVFSIVTGIVMAFKFGRSCIAVYTLLAGFVVPALLIVIFSR